MYELGKKIYKQTCVSCHGADGSANVTLKFVVEPRALSKTILTQEQSYQIIKKGAKYWGAHSDMMPSFESVYSEKELRAVSYYINKTFHPESIKKVDRLYKESKRVEVKKYSKMLKRGKKIYKRNCSWCHGMTAHGDGEATRNPEKSIFPYDLTKTLLTDKQMFLYIKYGGRFWGTKKDDMPNWSKKYDDFTIKSVVKYINKSFKNQE
jgi:mono/diheme cytochrome c family protein